MSAFNKGLAFIAIGASSAGVIFASYSNEKAQKKIVMNNLHNLHSESEGVLTPEKTRSLSRQEMDGAREAATKLKTRNSGNYYGLVTGEYAQAKQ
eukprot:932415-Rhodomonas_salina.2